MNNFDEIENKHKVLIDKSKEYMKNIKKDDLKHTSVHVENVVKYTKEILEVEENANKEVCIISAYWHDVGRTIQKENHAQISADMLKVEMEKMGYNIDFIDSCYKAIYKHSYNNNPETLEGNIIRDADKIDFIGIDRWKNCISENSKFTKIIELLPNLRNNIIKLECSRKIYDREIVKLVEFLHNYIFKMEG